MGVSGGGRSSFRDPRIDIFSGSAPCSLSDHSESSEELKPIKGFEESPRFATTPAAEMSGDVEAGSGRAQSVASANRSLQKLMPLPSTVRSTRVVPAGGKSRGHPRQWIPPETFMNQPERMTGYTSFMCCAEGDTLDYLNSFMKVFDLSRSSVPRSTHSLALYILKTCI